MRKTAIALALALLPSLAAAQTFPTVPSQTVIGRTAIGTGPSQAIPFATLLTQLGAVPTSRSILTTAPLAGGGNLSADRTLSITALGISTALLANNAVTNAKLATMPAFTFKGNNTSGAAVPTDVDIAALTTKGSPAAGDFVIISDQAASGAWKKATVGTVGAAGTVSSIAGNTGAFTLGTGLTNSTNDIRVSLTNFVGALGSDVALNTAYATGPTANNGTTGVFKATGKVTAVDTGAVNTITCKLWDGTNAALDSGVATSGTANGKVIIALSGFSTNPAAGLRISCKAAAATGNVAMLFNNSGESLDSTVRVVRIQP